MILLGQAQSALRKGVVVRKNLLFLLLFLFANVTTAWAASGFVIQRINVQGLQRISYGTVLSYLPVKAGDRFTTAKSAKIIKALYKTNFFSNVSLLRRGNELIIAVVERPVIGEIHISGNKKITTKQLKKALKQSGFTQGQVFDRSVLVGLKQALLQQYYNLGRYNAHIYTKITRKVRNRVIVNINIYEGPVAKVKTIKVIGNRRFSDRKLLKNFSLSRPSLWSWITGSDQYSKEKLNGDLEKLRSYYMDRGYLDFKVDSAQVSITPDKRHVYVIVHVSEGYRYIISGVNLSGNLLGHGKALNKLITIHAGQVFSRQKIIDIVTNLTKFFGDRGYALPTITPQPKVDNRNHKVFINFAINPGKRVYVRRVGFVGNTRTADYVLRREMRQMEGGLYNLSAIKESKRRLANLGYLQNIQTQLSPVPGHPDQVDLTYHVKDASSAAASFQVGYSDANGFLYGASVNEQNFMGTGKSVGVQFNNSAYMQSYSFNYFNPYYTINNVSMGFSIFANRVTPGAVSLGSYSMNSYGGAVTYGFPVTEKMRINFGYGYEYDNLDIGDGSSTEAKAFVNKHGHIFDQIKVNSSLEYSNLDRAVFPTNGFTNSLGADLGLPVGGRSLEFYTISDDATWYYPLVKHFILNLHGYAGYGNGYGHFSDGLPFFKNFLVGGIGSVRGFEPSSLGPKDSNGDPLGGNVSVNGSVGVIFPNPLGASVRTMAFVDAGNVYENRFDLGELRYSAGIQVEWRTPMGTLVFAVATPLHKKAGDEPKWFDFTIGAGI